MQWWSKRSFRSIALQESSLQRRGRQGLQRWRIAQQNRWPPWSQVLRNGCSSVCTRSRSCLQHRLRYRLWWRCCRFRMYRMRRYNRHVRLVGYRRIGSLHQLRNRSQCRNRRKLHRRASCARSTGDDRSSNSTGDDRSSSSTSRPSSTGRSSSTGSSFGQRRSKGIVLSGPTGSFQTTNPSFPSSGQNK